MRNKDTLLVRFKSKRDTFVLTIHYQAGMCETVLRDGGGKKVFI